MVTTGQALRSLMFTALLCLPASLAHGYAVSLVNGDSGAIVKWPTKTATYALHPACSEDMDVSTCHGELRASFARWTSDCSGLEFVEEPMSSNKSLTSIGGSTNNINELAFIEDNVWQYGSYVLGVTGPVFGLNGEVFEADIAFNGLHHKWTSGSMGFATQDVQNVAVHEIGHYFGLQHALTGYGPDNPPTMAPAADNNLKSQTPEADDLDGLCFLYPAATWSCESDADCPYVLDQGPQGDFYHGILSCEGGLCGGVSTEVPGGTVGDVCVSDNDCEDGLDCVSGLCSQSCVTDDDCPDGTQCSGSSCVNPNATTPPTSPGGELVPCSDHLECLAGAWGGGVGLGVCVDAEQGGYCRTVCQSDSDCAGADCMSCQPAAEVIFFGEVTACVPVAGCLDDGAACTGGDECASGLCWNRVCEQPCSVGDDSVCEEGLGCTRFTESGLDGYCAPKGALPAGELCERDDLCASLLCIEGVCAVACDPDTGAPCIGGACEASAITGLSLCAPGAAPAPPPEEGEEGVSSSSSSGGGGCGGGPTSWAWPLALLALALGRRRP